MNRLVFLCVLALVFPQACIAQNYTNFRVTTAFSDRSPSLIRVSFVQPSTAPADPSFESSFSYNANFKYRWTSNKVSTGLFNVTAGAINEVVIPGAPRFNVSVPLPGQGIRGIMTGDICYASPVTTCQEGEHDEILSHLPTILNTAMKYPGDISFWSIIGDNFYDANGATTTRFWDVLSTDTKSRIFYSVPGNYEFWSSGNPATIVPAQDQFGNGFMQYHGMDALSSAADARQPWNFTNNPDDDTPSSLSGSGSTASTATSSSSGNFFVPGRQYLADASNFEYVTQVGNLGIIGYSGAHTVDDTVPFLEYACNWIGGRLDTIDWIILLGHWAKADKGANADTYTPGMYAAVTQLAGCDVPGMVKYFSGHEHCNRIDVPNTGFIVGGFGKSEKKKCNEFGIPVLDSTGGRLQVFYFPVSQIIVPSDDGEVSEAETKRRFKGAKDRYTALMNCIDKQPLSSCVGQIETYLWMNVSVSDRMGVRGL